MEAGIFSVNVLIRQDRIYEQVYYDREAHFSAIVKSELSKIVPDFSIVDFSPYIVGDEGNRRRPDLALVDRSYKTWAVVEVELEQHSLEHHILPQIHTFATGRYDSSHAAMLHAKDSTLDLRHLRNLTTYVPPLVLVVVNSRSVMDQGWGVLESDYSARLTFLESYRSEDGDVVVLVSGYLPVSPPYRIIRLKKTAMINALTCVQPEDVPAAIGTDLWLYWGQQPRRWQVVRARDHVIFFPADGFTVRADRNYEVLRIGEGKYQLREL